MSLGFAAFTYFMLTSWVITEMPDAPKNGRVVSIFYALYNEIPLVVSTLLMETNTGCRDFYLLISNTTPLGLIVWCPKWIIFEDGEIPQVLRYKIYRNSFISLTKSPLMERFPIGGELFITILKNQNNYIERPLKPGRYAWLTKCALSISLFSWWL